MGKIHKIKRQFRKSLPIKAGRHNWGGVSVVVYERPDSNTFWISHWWGGHQSLIKQLEREYLGGSS